MTKPFWITPAGFLATVTELVSTSTSLQSYGTGTTYSLISGQLPGGLTLSSSGIISGIPNAVVNTLRKKFVVRVKNNDGLADRTFYMDAEGPDDPTWSTAPGYLPLGYNGEGYILNYQYSEYNLAATAVIPDSTQIRYYIEDGDGSLPGGMKLEQNGKLSGFVYENLPAGAAPILFEFYVTATDGVSSSKRLFKFYVVTPDMFRADATWFTFDTDFITSATSSNSITSGTTVITTTTLPVNLSLLSVNNLLFTNTGSNLQPNTKITAIGYNSFTINKASTGTIATGTVLSFYSSTNIDILSVDSIESSIGYLQPPQFLNGTDLGTVRANNNQTISVEAYDAVPYRGPLTYSLTTGTTVNTRLPEGLYLDSESGFIYGNLPYQPAYTRTYTITINATKTDNRYGTQVTATNTFTLAVKGEVESSIEWISDSNLGSIETGYTSELFVKAQQLNSDYTIKYDLSSGLLPPGLTLTRDGSITGVVDYGSTGTYTFAVLASDVYELSWITKQFNLEVISTTSTEFTKIYCRPFLSKEKRTIYKEFITDTFTFDPKLIYRYYDQNFGIQTDIKMYLDFGIEKVNLSDYAEVLNRNFYRKNFYFGEVKKAIAKSKSGLSLYEVIYVDALDGLTNNTGTSVNKTISINNNTYYPASIDNMRSQLHTITLPDSSLIEVNPDLLPRYMNTAQPNEFRFPGYMRVIPICYALPGQGDRIISRIKLSGFNFNMLDFEVDRIIVENSADNTSAKYLILGNQTITG